MAEFEMNIIELAKEAGFEIVDEKLKLYFDGDKVILKPNYMGTVVDGLKEFAALVRAEERKRTVEILMEMHRKANGEHNYYHFAANEIQGYSV